MNLARCLGYVASTLLVVSSLIFLSVLVSLYKPYIRSALYTVAVCNIETSFYIVQYTCDCGPNCRSLYPCLILYANIEGYPARKDGSTSLVMLYQDDHQQAAVLAAEDTLQQERCSMHICKKTAMESRDNVELFRRRDGLIGTQHKCYYDPSDISRGAVFKRTYDWFLVFNIFFWPGLALILGICICAGVCYLRRKKSHFVPERPNEENPEASTVASSKRAEMITGSQLCFVERY